MRTALSFLAIASLAAACGDNLEVGADALSVSPESVTLEVGGTETLTATYTIDGATVPADDVTWTSSNPATVSVAGSGASATITANVVGSATISASGRGLHAAATVGVGGNVVLVSIALTPTAPTLAAGTMQQLTATGTFSDDSTMDVTGSATWTTDEDTVATVVGGLVDAVAPGDATITATVGTVSGMTTVTVTDATLVSLQVDPTDPSVALGVDPQFTATGTFSDTTVQDLTTQVTWTSSDEAVATIAASGLADTLTAGTTTITAALGGIMDTSELTVTVATLESITVTPVDPSIALGLAQQFTATGMYSDGSTPDITDQVTWTSSDEAVATVSDATPTKGLATSAAAGTTTITATFAGVLGSSDLTVTAATLISIAVAPVDPTVVLGLTRQFTAIGTYTDGTTPDITTQVTWSSSDEAVAQISNAAGSHGLATTLATGTTTITASLDGVDGTSVMTVAAATLQSIAVTPIDPSVSAGTPQQFTAIGTYSDGSTPDITTQVTWSSSDETVATISNVAGANGLATTLIAGTTTITASLDGIDGTSDLTVTQPAPTVIARYPQNGATGIRLDPPIIVTFSLAMNPATLTGQTATGACTDTIQVSGDGFATCLGFTAAAPVMSAGDTVASLALAAPLATLTTYRIRVLASVQSAAGAPMGTTDTQAIGFTTATDGRCGATLMISQVYGGGGNSGAPFNADFVELHNPGPTAVNLAGMAVQYASSAGTSWQATPLPVATVPAGGYFLVQISTAGATGAALTPDHLAAPAIAMSASSGKIALTTTTTPLAGACPLGSTLDLVGYGAATCFEVAPTAGLGNTTAAIRAGGGCDDGNNSVNFAVAAPAPRGAATGTAPLVCECTANETNAVAEADFCVLQFPATISTTVGGAGTDVFARVFETGVTEAPGSDPRIRAQIGLGPTGVNPTTTPGWSWITAAFNVQVGNDDEYVLSLAPPGTPGTYSYTGRFSRDAVNWTYCDLDGAGSNAALTFDPLLLGVMTVLP